MHLSNNKKRERDRETIAKSWVKAQTIMKNRVECKMKKKQIRKEKRFLKKNFSTKGLLKIDERRYSNTCISLSLKEHLQLLRKYYFFLFFFFSGLLRLGKQ